MFGYVRTNKMELKHRESMTYKGYYCGICKTLKKEYGERSRMALNYDTTFLQIVLTSLYEPKDTGTFERCISHPHKKEAVIINEISSYSSAMNIMLMYYKLKDDYMDDRDILAAGMLKLIEGAFQKAKAKYPKKEEAIRKNLEELFRLEKEQSKDIQQLSMLFGDIMGEMFAYKEDVFAKNLYQIGFYLGKYIYIVDAFEDLYEDLVKNKYNPLKGMENKELFEAAKASGEKVKPSIYTEEQKAKMKEELFFILSLMSDELDRLPLLRNKGIIDNIIFSGIVIRLNKALKEPCIIEEEI